MRAELRLEDGTRFEGTVFGAAGSAVGEVVFTTAMTGYVESLTDPSYRGQILVLTYPLAGGYGVPPDRPEGSLIGPFESSQIQVQGVVLQNPIDRYSHHAGTRSLSQWLESHGIPGIAGVDTRALTIHLRAHGTMRGWLIGGESAHGAIHEVEMDNVGWLVAPLEIVRYEGGDRTVLVIDAGAKDHLVRSLLARGVSVLRAPFTAEVAALAATVDGVVIGSGPGDPKQFGSLIDATRGLLRSYSRPIFGLCLGNQILALAAGGETEKLPYGHRGVNQPVRELQTSRCYVTSQNHGYAVINESLPQGWEPWFVNTNDGTNEGVRSTEQPHFGVQFHPEAHPGPDDTAYLFDDFLQLVHSMEKQ